jgi:phenylacetic acid degradation operon negative regulatory protein
MKTARPVRLDHFRETVLAAPVSYSVYSAFSFYGARRGGELPGTWLVAALGELGHEVAAIRQTLYRLELSGVLHGRSAGRNKFYRLSPAARAEAEAGLAKIMAPATEPWDGQWTLVQFGNHGEEQVEKELLRELVRAEGFARIGPGLFIHPRDRVRRLRDAVREHRGEELLTLFRAARVETTSEAAFVARHWDLDDLAQRYRAFLDRYRPVAKRVTPVTGADAFLLRFALVFDYLETAWQDPELPAALLPARWPGVAAQRLAKRLYQRMLPEALAFGDRL